MAVGAHHGSLRRRLSALFAAVMVVGVGAGIAAAPADAAEDHVIVTFTFDDARVSQYPMIPVFAAHGAKATIYANSGLMGTNGIMTWNQLRDMYGAGHEIAGHTAHHTPLTDVDPATARAEIQADITAFQAQGLPRPVSFAYPVGYYGTAEEDMVKQAGYASARTIDTDRRETVPPVDPYAVRVMRDSLDGSEGLQALKNDVLSAESRSGKTWIVYLMHEFYSPIDEEIDDFLTWLGPRAASGTVVKTVRDVMVPAGNQPPVAVAGPAQTVAQGSSVTLDGSGSRDPNGTALSYQWTQTGGPAVSLSSTTVATPTFTAPATASTLTFQLTVGDGEFSASDSVTITVVPESSGGTPTFRSSSSTGNDAWSTAATVAVPAGATTGDVVVATVGTWGGPAPAVTPPAGFTLKGTYTAGEDTARVFWKRLTAPESGTYQFSWSGGRWSSAHAMAVSGAATIGDPVEAVNHATGSGTTFPTTSVSTVSTPLLAWIGRNDEPASGHAQPTGFTEVQDKDCTALAYRQPPAAGTHVASGATSSGGAGPLHSVLVAVKGGTTAPVNSAPVARAGTAQSVATGATVTLDGSASTDADADPLTYAWSQTAGPSVTLSSASAAKPTFTAPSTSSTLTFQLTVSDGKATSSDTTTVTVTAPPPVNTAPVARAGAAQSVATGATVTLDGSASTDADADPLTYAWSQTAGPSVTLSSASAAKPTFTAPSTSSTLTFQLTVSDGKATSSDTTTVTVTAPPPVNTAPVARAGAAQSVATGATVTLDGSASTDADADPLTYAWSQTAGPSVTLSSASAAKPTFTAPSTSSTLTFQLTVSDGKATSSDTTTVTVTAPPPVNPPTYRSSSSTGNDAFATGAKVPVPAGATAGDVVVATVATWGSGTPPTVGAPAGFTLKATYTGVNSGGADTVRVFWKRLTAADTGTYQFNWSGGKRWSSGHAIAVSGTRTSGDPLEAVNRAGSASATTFPSTTVTTTGNPLLAWIGRNDQTASQHTPPTGFTKVQDKNCTALAVRSSGGLGTYTASGAAYTGTAGPLQAVLIAIR